MRPESLLQTDAVSNSENRDNVADVSPTIYVVDQEEANRHRLVAQLRASGYRAKEYESAEDFLKDVDRHQPGCLLLEVRLAGMTGPELQRMVRRLHLPVGIVFMAARADIRLAVALIRAGAVDFIEKPVVTPLLLSGIRAALADARRRYRIRSESAELAERYGTLTMREKEVMRLMTEGHPTKIVARRLGLSPRTIETHRMRIMEKMAARTLSTLVRQSIALDRILGRFSSD